MGTVLMERKEAPHSEGPELVGSHAVAARMSVSERTLWRMVANGTFPQPVRFSRKMVRWVSADVGRYIASLSRPVSDGEARLAMEAPASVRLALRDVVEQVLAEKGVR